MKKQTIEPDLFNALGRILAPEMYEKKKIFQLYKYKKETSQIKENHEDIDLQSKGK
jgi:hypothetical protein